MSPPPRTCLCSQNSFSNIEELFFESLGISGQASNATGQFHWCFTRIFSESWLSASRIFFLVSMWSNYKYCDFTRCPSSAPASVSNLSQGNFWNRLTNVLRSLKKSLRNLRQIRFEFQTAWCLAFLKPYSVAGFAGCMNVSTWRCFPRGANSWSARRLVPKISRKAKKSKKSMLTTHIFQPPISGDENIWSIFSSNIHHLKLNVRIFLPINNTIQHVHI